MEHKRNRRRGNGSLSSGGGATTYPHPSLKGGGFNRIPPSGERRVDDRAQCAEAFASQAALLGETRGDPIIRFFEVDEGLCTWQP
jgi:hypothetical protein